MQFVKCTMQVSSLTPRGFANQMNLVIHDVLLILPRGIPIFSLAQFFLKCPTYYHNVFSSGRCPPEHLLTIPYRAIMLTHPLTQCVQNQDPSPSTNSLSPQFSSLFKARYDNILLAPIHSVYILHVKCENVPLVDHVLVLLLQLLLLLLQLSTFCPLQWVRHLSSTLFPSLLRLLRRLRTPRC